MSQTQRKLNAGEAVIYLATHVTGRCRISRIDSNGLESKAEFYGCGVGNLRNLRMCRIIPMRVHTVPC